MARPPTEESGRVRAHRLDSASSTYLRAAAEQAIDWHPWGAEPFELARSTGRPVLLDIGASWCHWCHVMDEGTYADAEVARLIGELFVAVKVDRDERPEVDRRYQREVGALTGEGGWPLTAFLTPGGEAFLGGTYFPVEEGHGRPGFRRVLLEVARVYREEPERLEANLEALRAALDRRAARRSGSRSAGSVARFVGGVAAALASSYDPSNGGFGSAPKFPHPIAARFQLWESFATGDPVPAQRAHETLHRMADGGMHDQLGGGFHRYSVDEAWHIPHFEKMAIDNAALLLAYVESARRFDCPRCREVVGSTAGWIRTTLGDPGGGFATSQDADNAPGDDGRYFTWSREELHRLLDADQFRVVTRYYGIGTEGRMPHAPEENVLFRMLPAGELAETLRLPPDRLERLLTEARASLLRERGRRPTPAVDRARYSGINGALVAALARAAGLLGDRAVLADAVRAADLFLTKAYDPARGVAHRLDGSGGQGFGLLEDNAAFALGLLELAGETLEARFVEAARALLELIDRRFRDESGLLRELSAELYDGPPIGRTVASEPPIEDVPHLSANAAAALANLRLAALLDDAGALARAQSLVEALASRLEGAGLFGSGAALASGLLATPSAHLVIEGEGPTAGALERAARSAWHPNLWVVRGRPPAPFALAGELRASVDDGPRAEARALLCVGPRCAPPIRDPAALAEAIAAAERPTLSG